MSTPKPERTASTMASKIATPGTDTVSAASSASFNGDSTFTTTYASPLGILTLAATDRGVCGVYFERHKYFPELHASTWRHSRLHPYLTNAIGQLDDYFAGTRTRFDVPLDLGGTPFQRSVWQQLSAIEFGATVTYADHAARVGRPKAVRAVGTAIGRNPLSILLPCHRVIGSTGQLAGYAGGLERKRYLLALESSRTLPLLSDAAR